MFYIVALLFLIFSFLFFTSFISNFLYLGFTFSSFCITILFLIWIPPTNTPKLTDLRSTSHTRTATATTTKVKVIKTKGDNIGRMASAQAKKSQQLLRQEQLFKQAKRSVRLALDAEEKIIKKTNVTNTDRAIPYKLYQKAKNDLLACVDVRFNNDWDMAMAEVILKDAESYLFSVNERLEALKPKPSAIPIGRNQSRASQIMNQHPPPQQNKKVNGNLQHPNEKNDNSILKKVDAKNLKHIDPHITNTILNEILTSDLKVTWDDVAGQEKAKQALHEIVVLPALRPDLFTGLRSPCRGLLLFGPPGNGKTMLAKAVASQSKCVFFAISASSLTSKWVGEGEKLVRALFAIAREVSPSIIFIDELDSILKSRSENENESMRRLKTEFLLAFDGVGSGDEHVLVMGATNRPQDLDSAALRRFPKRLYLELPDLKARQGMLNHLLYQKNNKVTISKRDLDAFSRKLEGYSGSDIAELCKDAALEPIRELGAAIANVRENEVRGISINDLSKAMKRIRPSVPQESLNELVEWNQMYGEI